MPRKLATVSVVDAVADDLRRRVLDGDLRPGDALAENEVAAAYSVARPTAKTAIEKLVRERLLERNAHRTARVVALTADAVTDIYRTREIFEAEALRVLAAGRTVPDAARAANAEILALVDAAPRALVEPDMRFHRSLVAALDSARVDELYGALASEVVFCMSQVQGAQLLPSRLIAEEHELLLQRIEDGDPEGAVAALSAHLGRARDRFIELLGGADRG